MLHVDGVSSGGPTGLSFNYLGDVRISFDYLWTLCINRMREWDSGLVNTQRDRTHIMLDVDGVSSGSPSGLSFNYLG